MRSMECGGEKQAFQGDGQGDRRVAVMKDRKTEVDRMYRVHNALHTRIFTLFWRDGKREVVSTVRGTVRDALMHSGYGQGAIAALDFWADGDCKDYVWNKNKHAWEKADADVECQSEDPM